MTSYTNVKVRISEGKKDKLKKAFESNCESIAIRLMSTDLNGKDVISIIKSQLGRLMKAYEVKKGLTIKMSRREMAYNIEGAFLTNAGWIDPILNRNCFASFRGWGIIGTVKYGCSKTNRKWFVS